MAVRRAAFYPGAYAEKLTRYTCDATTVAGAFAVRSTATNSAGEVVDASTTGAADLVGIYAEAVVYSATQADFNGFPGFQQSGEEGTVGIIADPFAVYALLAAGSATDLAALATAAPANILVNETADTTGLTVTDDVVGTVSMAGGILIGKTGNNGSIYRRIITHTNNTSTAVEVPYPFTIAVNDQFIRLPWSRAGQTVQLTTNLRGADATIVTGTGAPFAVMDFEVDTINNLITVLAVARDHQFNPLS